MSILKTTRTIFYIRFKVICSIVESIMAVTLLINFCSKNFSFFHDCFKRTLFSYSLKSSLDPKIDLDSRRDVPTEISFLDCFMHSLIVLVLWLASMPISQRNVRNFEILFLRSFLLFLSRRISKSVSDFG